MIDRTYRISDVVNEEFLRFPLILLSNPRYKEMSLEAKFVYALLLNRLTLSQKNGWINEDNEVYLIYTREEAASLLNISYKKAISAFRELIEKKLLYEQRQGRGYPNLLYVRSRTVAFTHQELPEGHLSKIKNIQTEISENDSSPSVYPEENSTKERTDEEAQRLNKIFERCELDLFHENIQRMFRAVIERLYYSETVKIGNSRMPGDKIRSYLELLEADDLIAVLDKMKQNQAKIINPTGYMMSMIFNELCEKDSGLILSLPPEYQPTSNFYLSSEDNWKGDG